MTGSLSNLFNPKSVAVVGASDKPGNRGGQAITYLRKFGYAGTVVPVHPSGNSVHGYEGVTSLDELEAPADVALLAVGARNVADVVTDLGRHGIGAAVVWAGGFAENGGDGVQLQTGLAEAARAAGVRLLGPNCLGLVNTGIGFCGTFASWLNTADRLLPGHISMVTQSGGLGAFAHSGAQDLGVGFRFMVSTGNEADISAVEVLEMFAEDPETHVICSYLEGTPEGPRLIRALRRARANGKDVIILKGGRSAASARAVAAHTGAMAGQARIWGDILTDVGAIQVTALEDLIEVATALVHSNHKPRLHGRRVAVMSYGGGSGVLASDLVVEAGLELPPLSADLQNTLRPLVPPIASLRNPIDLTPEAFNQDAFRAKSPDVLAELERTDEIDALLLQGGAMSRGADEAAANMSDFHDRSAKQLAIYWPAAPESARAVFRERGVRVFDNQKIAVDVLRRVVAARQAGLGAAAAPLPAEVTTVDLPVVLPGQVLGEDQVAVLLRAAGVPTLTGRLATTADDAVAAAGEAGFPVAMKVVSPRITHRAAAGLVRLRIADDEAVRGAWDSLVQGAGDAPIEGVYVQQMAPSGGIEFLVSALRDETFGPIVSVGAGGVQTELLDDVVFAPAPLDETSARRVVDRLRIAGYLAGKGQDACLGPLAAFVAALSRFSAALPWPGYVLEVNPVLATPERAVALDGLLIIEEGHA